MTPLSFSSAMDDWRRDRELLRQQHFYSLPAELMCKLSGPKDLYTLPWEEDVEINYNDIDWSLAE